MSLKYYRREGSSILPGIFLDHNEKAVMFEKAPGGSKYRIFKMYRDFKPESCFQGLPPADPVQLYGWISLMLESGLNVTGRNMYNDLVCHGVVIPVDRERAEIIIAVDMKYQGRGVGFQLTRILKKLCQDLGFSRIWLSVESQNTRARHIYQRLGFVIVSREWNEESWEAEVPVFGSLDGSVLLLDEEIFHHSGSFEETIASVC